MFLNFEFVVENSVVYIVDHRTMELVLMKA